MKSKLAKQGRMGNCYLRQEAGTYMAAVAKCSSFVLRKIGLSSTYIPALSRLMERAVEVMEVFLLLFTLSLSLVSLLAIFEFIL